MKKNLAVVYNKTFKLPYYYYLNDELFKLLKDSKYNVKYFGYTDQPAFLKRDGIEFSLCNSFESLHYWLRPFEADIIVGVGGLNDKWGEVIRYNATKYLINRSKNTSKVFNKVLTVKELYDIFRD